MSWTPLLGHDSVLTRLRNALQRGRLGHAFLFVGPEGVGKRRVAQHVAQGLLCETNAPETLDPCGRCAGCRQVETASHPDFFEIAKPADKMELPIALMQQLVGQLGLKPARGAHKIAVVDDADLLNEESANCFLKTLEEPPPGSLLILISSAVETQLATIVSRCQVLRFNPLSTDEVASLMVSLGAAEESTARKLAQVGAGSVGRALESASEEWVEARGWILDGLGALPAGSVALARELQRFVADAGKDAAPRRARARQVVLLAADFYRNCWRRLSGRGLDESEPVANFADRMDVETILDLADRCLQADRHIARYLNQSLALDCWIDDLSQIAQGLYVSRIA